MRAILLAVAVVMAASACSERPYDIDCFPSGGPKVSGPQLKALNDAKRRAADHCSGSRWQCGFNVTLSPDNSRILVGALMAEPHREAKGCVSPVGGQRVYVYDLQGHFESEPLAL